MIKHIVFWRLKDSALGRTKAENIALLRAEIEALRELVPGVVSLEVGTDFERSADAWDIALYTEFATREDLAAYQVHPAHERVKELVGQVRESRAVVDYEV